MMWEFDKLTQGELEAFKKIIKEDLEKERKLKMELKKRQKKDG